MSAGILNQQPQLRRVLEDCRRQIVLHTVVRGVATVLIVAISAVLVATFFDYLFGLPTSVRTAGLIIAVGLTGWTAWKSLVSPLMDSMPPTQLAAAVDLSCPELDESLATLMSLQNPNVTSAETGSQVMRSHLEHQVSERLAGVTPNSVVDSHATQRRSGAAASLLVLAALPVLLWPSGSKLLLERMVRPLSNLATASNLYFEVENPNRTVARGTDLQLSATPVWRTESHSERPERVLLEIISTDGKEDSLPMSFDEVSGTYVAQIPRITDSIQYRITGGSAQTERFVIQVVDAPEIRTAIMTATPPEYTGLAVKQFDGMLGRMQLFERSDVSVELEFNKPVTSAALVWIRRDRRPVSEVVEFDREFDHLTGEEIIDDGSGDWDPSRSQEEKAEEPDPEDEDPDAPWQAEETPLAMRVDGVLSIDGMSACIKMTADVGGDFVIEVLDEYQLQNPPEPDRSIEVIYDQPPELVIHGVHDGDRFRPNDILPVDAVAIDDIGIGAFELHYRVNEEVTRIVSADNFEPGSQEVAHGFRLQLKELEVTSGDRVSFRAKAVDERPDPGRQETWSQEVTVRLDDNAEAAGAKAMQEEAKAIVDALKRLEKEIAADKEKARQLKEKEARDWDQESRSAARRLSEKEQQQGRLLESVSERVATHPLMKDSADELRKIAEQLKDQIPENLDEATTTSRNEAKELMQKAESQLENVRDQLHKEIDRIEKIAELEQNLAELNRLALEAEQLAADADQLSEDRRDSDSRPNDVDDQEWQQNLNDRQEQLGEQQQGLTEDLERLLRVEQELLEAAQRAQREELEEVGEMARQLAEQQQNVAEGVGDEAKQAGQDARELAKQLEKARKEAQKLNEQLERDAPDMARPELDGLQDAADNLRQGDLAQPQTGAEQAARDLEKTAEQLRQATTANENIPAPQREKAAEAAHDLSEELSQVAEQIENLREKRNAMADFPRSQEESQAGSTDQDLPDAEESPRAPVEELLERLGELAEVADEIATGLEDAPSASQNAQQEARQAADSAQQGLQEARAGKFSEASQELRRGADAAENSARQTNAAGQEDQQKQMAGLGDELDRAAETLENLQLDDASQATAQQKSQRDISDQAGELPQRLADLEERLNMDALQMADEAQQAGQAQQAAQQAQQSSQQASSELQSGQLQQAEQSGQQAATELRQAADAAQGSGEQPGNESGLIPSEVGESVAEALQNLAKAAQTMQQASESGSEGEPGQSGESAEQAGNGPSGQPGQGEQAAEGQQGQSSQPGKTGQSGQPGKSGKPSGSQQLSDAAESLAQAAQQALPNQFTPGQKGEGSKSAGEGADATGNTAMWNGLLPGQANAPAGTRDWGKQNQELDTETTGDVRVSRDSEYQDLIRMYFREVAKATAEDDQ